MTKYGKPQAEIIFDMHEKGASAKIISQALDMPLYRVNAILKFAKEDKKTFVKVMKMKRTGMTDADIARALGFSKQYISRLSPKPKTAKGTRSRRTMLIEDGVWHKCQKIAEEFGLIVEDGVDAGQGSVRKLIEQIGLGNLYVLRHQFPGEL